MSMQIKEAGVLIKHRIAQLSSRKAATESFDCRFFLFLPESPLSPFPDLSQGPEIPPIPQNSPKRPSPLNFSPFGEGIGPVFILGALKLKYGPMSVFISGSFHGEFRIAVSP